MDKKTNAVENKHIHYRASSSLSSESDELEDSSELESLELLSTFLANSVFFFGFSSFLLAELAELFSSFFVLLFPVSFSGFDFSSFAF